MERNGLVCRKRDAQDRRVNCRLHMLDKKYQMIKEVLENRKRYLSNILKQLADV